MRQTVSSFHELTFVDEGDECVVGRPETGVYVVLPADGAQLLKRLVSGAEPRAAAEWFELTFGESVDLDEFFETLSDLGFVRRDGERLGSGEHRPVRFQRLGRALFSPVAYAGYLLLVAVGVWVVAGHRDLVVSPAQIFFTGSLLVVQLTITFGQLPLVFLHEGYHMLAGRRRGLPSRLGISNRLMYIVFETTMNNVLSLPRQQRYQPFLAGMLIDVVVLAALDLTAHLSRAADGSFTLIGRIALAFAFTVVMRLIWQFQFYLRTDLYYVFATASNCYDLHDASTALVRNRLWRLLGRPDRIVDERQWTERDLRIGRWYGPLVVLGALVCVAVAVFGSLPVVVQYGMLIAQRLGAGKVDAPFFDALVSLSVNIATGALVVVLARRKRRS